MNASTKWTIAIAGLLAGNVVATVVLAAVANAGKSQVIPDYYDHAAHYDDAIDEANRSAKLGWHVDATMSDHRIDVRVIDATGAPLLGAAVKVTGYPRAHADREMNVSLFPAVAGAYGASIAAAAGRYDLRIAVDRGAEHFSTSLTVDATQELGASR